jgi:hypothetical protein
MATQRLIDLPLGEAGTDRTVAEMRRVVRDSLTDPLVVGYGRQIAAGCVPRDDLCRALSVRKWMGEYFQFERDPVGVELVMTPRLMLDRVASGRMVQGDCDDAAVLAASMGMSVGMRARFVLYGFGLPLSSGRTPLSHVYTVLQAGQKWVQIDVTRPERARPPSRVNWRDV